MGPLMLVLAAIAVILLLLYLRVDRLPKLLSDSRAISSQLANIPIPPPKHLPFLPVSLGVSHLLDLILTKPNPWEVISSWTLHYGNILRFSFLFNNFIIISDLALVRHVLEKNHQNYAKDVSVSYKPFMCLLGTGLVTSEGALWKKQRSLISPVFRGSILDEIAFAAKLAAKRLINKIQTLISESNKDEIEIEISEEFRLLTLQVIGCSVLGVSPEEADRVFPQLYLPIVSEANLRVWNPFRALIPSKAKSEFNSSVKQLNEYLSNLIQSRIQVHLSGNPPEKEDVLQKIINEVYNKPDSHSTTATTTTSTSTASVPAEQLDVRQMRDEIKTFLFAGHETSSMMLTWAFYEALKNPEVKKTLVDESIGMWGTQFSYMSTPESEERDLPGAKQNELGRAIKKQGTTGLEYTENVLKEALRKYSIVPVVTREVLKDETVTTDNGSYFLPKGAKIVIPIKAMNEREDLWGKDSKEFRPERFREKTEGLNEWRWLGFIAGSRQCVGQQFALLETKIVLSLLMNSFEMELAQGYQSVEKHKFNIPIGPEEGLRVKLRRRQF